MKARARACSTATSRASIFSGSRGEPHAAHGHSPPGVASRQMSRSRASWQKSHAASGSTKVRHGLAKQAVAENSGTPSSLSRLRRSRSAASLTSGSSETRWQTALVSSSAGELMGRWAPAASGKLTASFSVRPSPSVGTRMGTAIADDSLVRTSATASMTCIEKVESKKAAACLATASSVGAGWPWSSASSAATAHGWEAKAEAKVRISGCTRGGRNSAMFQRPSARAVAESPSRFISAAAAVVESSALPASSPPAGGCASSPAISASERTHVPPAPRSIRTEGPAASSSPPAPVSSPAVAAAADRSAASKRSSSSSSSSSSAAAAPSGSVAPSGAAAPSSPTPTSSSSASVSPSCAHSSSASSPCARAASASSISAASSFWLTCRMPA
mmetsp:Transcript_4997/g.16515  ORF Transcript_4997/g.16515 Transcript_4997/m.16515 type:complete len:389 (+) Transcript_4997:620-1786(+)